MRTQYPPPHPTHIPNKITRGGKNHNHHRARPKITAPPSQAPKIHSSQYNTPLSPPLPPPSTQSSHSLTPNPRNLLPHHIRTLQQPITPQPYYQPFTIPITPIYASIPPSADAATDDQWHLPPSSLTSNLSTHSNILCTGSAACGTNTA